MAEREDAIARFLNRVGWSEAVREPLAGDASFRRYERLREAERTAVLMDAPPPQEDVRPYVDVANFLVSLGYSAPRILAGDVEVGLLLVEDLGDATYTSVLSQGGDETALYALAVDLLIDLHRRSVSRQAPVPGYDDTRLLDEAMLLVDWYLPAIRGTPSSAALRDSYSECWLGLFGMARIVPETLVLRDYHVDNLMALARRDGIAACGLLDFQDAVIGPVAYDLVSLLEDARRDIACDVVAKMYERYLDAFPELDQNSFAAAYAVLGAQRHAKIVGIFTRLCARDGKPQYLEHIPRVWRLLEHDLAHPLLASMRAWFDRHIPSSDRVVPPIRTAA